ncbi:hypothetical protein H7F33_01975 [Pedobacter sp. PAMC26386]|nr:hypothetical protein H7F33_01975 [Pedobacter sp. PAMC26386]
MRKLELCNLGVEQLDAISMAKIEGGFTFDSKLVQFAISIPGIGGKSLSIRLFVPVSFGIEYTS